MADYIKREDVLERIDGIWDCADMVFEPNDHCCNMDDCSSCKWSETKDAIRRIVEHTPVADVREVVRGRWKLTGRIVGAAECACSRCGYISYGNAMKPDGSMEMKNFCPNCGADMRDFAKDTNVPDKDVEKMEG